MSDIGLPGLSAFLLRLVILALPVVLLVALNLVYCGRKTWGDFAAGRRASGIAGALSTLGSAAVLIAAACLGLSML